VGFIRGGKRKTPFDPVDSCQASFEILTSYPTRDTVKLVEDVLSNTDHITEIMQRSEPLELDSQSKLVKEVEDIIGKKARLFNVSTEANKLSPSITNICIFGPGNPSSSRSCNEFVVLTDLERTYEMILSLVDRLGGAHRPEG
jgi:acetylornithine deacetylase/succinyl-diaminopimelate desuccinylase-like protein